MDSGGNGPASGADSPRTALTIGVTGWCSATGCNQHGMLLTGT
jgi:hypothetical protein